MIEVPIYNIEGRETGRESLPEELFGIKPNSGLVHQVMLALAANRRRPYAHAKDRSEVRGGGKKPWRQKGTGRARHGSTRSPIWVGGGVTFGPLKERNYTQKINKKMKQKAFWMVLSSKVSDQKLVLLNEFVLQEPKTKLFTKALSALPMKPTKTLVVIAEKNSSLIRAGRNIPRVRIEHFMSAGIEDFLTSDYVLFTKESLGAIMKLHAYEMAS